MAIATPDPALEAAFRDVRRQIRDRVRIADVLRDAGYTVIENGRGGGRALCPFHDDRRPSLYFALKPTHDEGLIEVFQCFACGHSGDVFTLVQLLGNLPTRAEAIRSLAAQHGLPWPSRANGDASLVHKTLAAAASYYAARLTPEARAYLESRGLPAELIGRRQIGYAPPSPITAFTRHAEDLGLAAAAESLGLIRPSGPRNPRQDYFLGRIIFPVTLVGRVIDLQGRAFPDRPRTPRYLNLPRGRRRLYNAEDASREYVVLCEGIPDTLSVLAAGLPACGIYGTQGWTDELQVHFRSCRRVYVALDRDAAGRAIPLAKRFGLRGRVLTPPPELGPKGDLNDWLVQIAHRDPQRFRALLLAALAQAPTPWAAQILALPEVPAWDRHDQLAPLIAEIAHLPPIARDTHLELLSRHTGLRLSTLEEAARAALADPAWEPPLPQEPGPGGGPAPEPAPQAPPPAEP
jgi:DNA primase catalytic core